MVFMFSLAHSELFVFREFEHLSVFGPVCYSLVSGSVSFANGVGLCLTGLRAAPCELKT